MIRQAVGIFIILHGLVHIWFSVLALGIVPFQKDMGWTGESWILPANLLTLAALLYGMSAFLFVTAGITQLVNYSRADAILITSAIVSSIVIIVFWDGNLNMLVEKGLIGLLINIALIASVFL